MTTPTVELKNGLVIVLDVNVGRGMIVRMNDHAELANSASGRHISKYSTNPSAWVNLWNAGEYKAKPLPYPNGRGPRNGSCG